MGGEPYWYYTPYQADIPTSLQALRQQEFTAGRYNPVLPFIDFPITANSPAPGAQHPSIEAAMAAAEADGTRSILDIFQLSAIPYAEALAASTQEGMDLFCTSFPLSTEELQRLFGTDRPTHEQVESVLIEQEANSTDDFLDDVVERQEVVDEFWESIDRGTCRHIVIYDVDRPVEIFFLGYSFD